MLKKFAIYTVNSTRCIKKKRSLVSCELQWRCATAVVRMMKPYPNLSESVVQISCFWVGTC